MKAIRGATTVERDNSDDITYAVKELLDSIVECNLIDKDEIVCILFSNTADLHSFYPAKAAREAGFVSCALFSSAEPQIDGALERCIRVMVLTECDRQPVHIYLNGAQNLRKDLTKKMTIAVDGPAGSGKSTVSKIIAKKFDILYLDTGAMYRACALACRECGADTSDGQSVANVLNKVDIDVRYENGTQLTLIDGKDVSAKIRTPEISMLASEVSAHEYVRKKMVDLQRKIAQKSSCILDGRDIGTNVLPDADYKFYLTASAEVRARRRNEENIIKGYVQPYSEVLDEIIRRDEQDKNRKFAPLCKADDAVEIITDNMEINQVVDFIINIIQRKI